MPTSNAKRKAQELFEQANSLSDDGREDEALTLYLKSIELDPENSQCFYNIGLIYKYRNNWEESFRYNDAANKLNPDDEAARWNLGIAATALRHWVTARRVWEDCGITLPEGDGPISGDFGITPVRLNPSGNGEVVWAQRIDPVRAKILNVPLPESGYIPGDIVLHDGAAVGYRMLDEIEKPVFNVLELFEQAPLKTFKLTVHVDHQEDITELETILNDNGMIAEDWTSNYRILCRACSEGRPHDQHDTDIEADWNPQHEIGIGSSSEELLTKTAQKWADNKTKTIKSIECVLERPLH